MKRTASSPTMTDASTKTDRSLFFSTAIIPRTSAAMLKKKTFTVMSHHISSKESTPKIFTEKTETEMTIKKTIFSQTDHLPDFVPGFKLIIRY